MFEYVRNVDSAVQWFTNTYLLDERSADMVRDILLYVSSNYDNFDDSKDALESLLYTFELTHGEITKLASVI